jgi:hypothetical protein
MSMIEPVKVPPQVQKNEDANPRSTQAVRRLPGWMTKPAVEEPKAKPVKRKAKEPVKEEGDSRRKPAAKRKKKEATPEPDPDQAVVVIDDSDEDKQPNRPVQPEQGSFTSYQPHQSHNVHQSANSSQKEHAASYPSSSEDPLVSYFDALIHATAVPKRYTGEPVVLSQRRVSKQTEALLDDLFGTNNSHASN